MLGQNPTYHSLKQTFEGSEKLTTFSEISIYQNSYQHQLVHTMDSVHVKSLPPAF